MDRDVQVEEIKRLTEQRWVGLDIVANHEVGRRGIGLCQEIVKLGGSLQSDLQQRMSQRGSRSPVRGNRGRIDAYERGAIVEAYGEHTLRRVPDITWGPALLRSRTNFCTAGVRARGISRISISRRRFGHGNIWDLSSSHARIEGIDPLLGQLGQVREQGRETCRPGRSANRRIGDAIGRVVSALPIEKPLDRVSGFVIPSGREGALHCAVRTIWVGGWVSESEEREEQDGGEDWENHGEALKGEGGVEGGEKRKTWTNWTPPSRLLASPLVLSISTESGLSGLSLGSANPLSFPSFSAQSSAIII